MPDMELVVTHAFAGYVRGDKVTDPGEMLQILQVHAGKVVTVPVTTNAPQRTK